MSYSRNEISAAVTAIYKEKGVDVSVEVACSIADKLEEKLGRLGFLEARRYAINETISPKHYRSMEAYREARKGYNSVIGKVYSDHAHKSRKAKATKAAKVRKPKSPKEAEKKLVIEEGKKGQYKFIV
jgi:hypothetical protein